MKPTPTLPQSVIDFADFLNEPPQYEDLRMVRDYRHEAWARFEKVISDLSAALSVQPAAAVVGEPEGWKLVPIEPTTEMANKGADAFFSPQPQSIEDENARAASVYRRMLSTAPSAPEGWQPIETAPKDGTTILAYFPLAGLSKDWCRVVTVFWGGQQRSWIFAGRAASGFSREYQPTHWRPLPTPPALGGSHE